MRNNLIISTLSSILFNTAIAGLLTLINFEEHFWINFVFSQCIGLSIYVINATVMCNITELKRRLLVLAFTFPGSIVLGITLASSITGVGNWDDPRAWISIVIGLFFGGIGGITYFLSERIKKLDAEVRQRRINQVESEKRQIEAHLKLLQAQIEPHFLFNTLANVSSLIDTDPQGARHLLDRLNDWLRVALARARSEQALLDDELSLLENYLQILSIRFGSRLSWHIDVPLDARRTPFPPMLLQPLVENAIRHGIEPKIGGGTLRIAAKLAPDKLTVEVHDDGAGLPELMQHGAGLENVESRIAALYGNAGQLTLSVNQAGGTTASVEIPR
jgi:sensor histidine kinase YesM